MLWTAIYNGVARRTALSQRAATLQIQAMELEAGALRRKFDEGSGAEFDAAFAALRSLNDLSAAISALERDGAFTAMKRTKDIRYTIGQHLQHQHLGPCIPYGWDHECKAEHPPTAAAMDLSGVAGIIDNRKAYVGVDDAQRRQPFYRVQLENGRGWYCAQSLLAPLPLAECFRTPIKGTSFFFTAADRQSGCLVPRPELAARYPDDMAIMSA